MPNSSRTRGPWKLAWALLVACLGLTLAAGAALAQQTAPKSAPVTAPKLAELQQAVTRGEGQLKRIDNCVKELQQLAKMPMPAGLTRAQQANWNQQTQLFLVQVSRLKGFGAQQAPKVGASRSLLGGGIGGLSGGSADSAITQMAQMNLQFLALQNAVQMESRKFQTLSNAAKARHDVAMASIRNTRA